MTSSTDNPHSHVHHGQEPPLPFDLPVNNIIMAVKSNALTRVQYFLEQDPQSVNLRDSDNATPLHWAALDNYMEVAKLLVQHGATIDVESIMEGHTPLVWACIRGNTSMAIFLINNGADLNRRDRRGYHALHHAAMYDRLDTVYYILDEYRVNVNIQDSEGHTPLMWAAYMGFVPMIHLLLKCKADIALTDNGGYTALHWAAVKGHIHAVEVLIQGGAEIMATDASGNTPATEAKIRLKRYDHIVNYLYLAKSSPKIAQEGRSGYRKVMFSFAFLLVLWLFLSFAYAPLFIIAVPSFFVPCILTWRFYAQHRWIPNTQGRNPFWCGIFLASYFFSAAVFFFKLTPLEELMTMSSLAFTIYNVVWFLLFIHLLFMDPGIIPKNSVSREEIISAIREGKTSYCITCMARKPLRAKHCRTCDQCVARFDHYCPWLNNDVGFKNNRQFFVVLAGICITHIWFIICCGNYLYQLIPNAMSVFQILPFLYQTDPIVLELLLYHILFCIWQCYNLVYNFFQILRNRTLNESFHVKKYSYLWKNGQFHNVFDRGYFNNVKEFVWSTRDYFSIYEVGPTVS